MQKPDTAGRISYKWRITPEGSVESVNMNSNSTSSPDLANCLQAVIKGIRFPAAGSGKPTIVNYPFQFTRH
jgi:hypothetical protein